MKTTEHNTRRSQTITLGVISLPRSSLWYIVFSYVSRSPGDSSRFGGDLLLVVFIGTSCGVIDSVLCRASLAVWSSVCSLLFSVSGVFLCSVFLRVVAGSDILHASAVLLIYD